MIDGATVKHLKLIADERGRLMEILRSDEELFTRFGQVYMTTTYPAGRQGMALPQEAGRFHLPA